jgi:hypothetical protein
MRTRVWLAAVCLAGAAPAAPSMRRMGWAGWMHASASEDVAGTAACVAWGWLHL